MKDVIGDLGINIDDAQVDDILKEAKKPDEDKDKDGKDADKKDKKWKPPYSGGRQTICYSDDNV